MSVTFVCDLNPELVPACRIVLSTTSRFIFGLEFKIESTFSINFSSSSTVLTLSRFIFSDAGIVTSADSIFDLSSFRVLIAKQLLLLKLLFPLKPLNAKN